MNKKGQALVEFIVLIPFVVYIIMGIVDFTLIFNAKNNLEFKMTKVVDYYMLDEKSKIDDYLSVDEVGVSFSEKNSGNYTKLELDKKYHFLTPGLGKILGSPYHIKVERVVTNE